MIPKAEVLAVAEETGLLATTVEKDYALGWILFGIAQHPALSPWIFKGGTCLKKCFFDTYRFSEDLDFTVPEGAVYSGADIVRALREVGAWVLGQTGLEIPEDGVTIEELTNERGHRTYQARVTYDGPLQLPRSQRQRVKVDVTSDEIIAGAPENREVFHGYSDAPSPLPRVRCYTLTELVAEKLRALYEREGRARDVYDVVNVGRNFRSDIQVGGVRALAATKFAFKELPAPEPSIIMARIDPGVFAADWNNALRHQLPVLPQSDTFLSALRDVLGWLLGAKARVETLAPVPAKTGETPVPAVRFWRPSIGVLGRGAPVRAEYGSGSGMDRLRYAARNRLLARVTYHGVTRLVEPYTLRLPKTGNLLLYVHEVQRGGGAGEGTKALKVAELGEVQVTDRAFHARYVVEL